MEAPRTYRATAIVLRRVNVGETDRIVTFYTRERGKVQAIAKGARKPISKLAGPTELFSYGRYFLAVGRELDVLTQAEVRDSFPGIRRDLKRIAHATYLIELTGAFVEERERNPDLFDTLLSSLYLLEGESDPETVARYFDLRVMSLLGYRPELQRCVRCGNERAGDGMAFSPSLGGRVCPQCAPLPGDVIHLSAEAADAMRKLLASQPTAIKDLQFSDAVKQEISSAIRWYVRYRLDRELKSPEFIQALAARGSD